jgi:lipopolysaccharide biosynthesis glycosyltransferase
MKIAMCANRDLYPYLPTTINSILISNPNLEKLYLFIEDDELETIKNSKIEFININKYNDLIIREGSNCENQFTFMAMVRCYFPVIFPNEDKILYIDVDTLTIKDLTPFWEKDISNYYLAGVRNFSSDETAQTYVNSGVLMMNLKKMREDNIVDEVDRLLRRYHFTYPDQDALNLACAGLILFVDKKFNNMENDLAETYSQNYIIHFCGPKKKPWSKRKTWRQELWKKFEVDKIGG